MSQHPGLGARTPKGHGTKAQAPREGNPADTYLTHQPERHTRTSAAQIQRATPNLTAPPSPPASRKNLDPRPAAQHRPV